MNHNIDHLDEFIPEVAKAMQAAAERSVTVCGRYVSSQFSPIISAGLTADTGASCVETSPGDRTLFVLSQTFHTSHLTCSSLRDRTAPAWWRQNTPLSPLVSVRVGHLTGRWLWATKLAPRKTQTSTGTWLTFTKPRQNIWTKSQLMGGVNSLQKEENVKSCNLFLFSFPPSVCFSNKK